MPRRSLLSRLYEPFAPPVRALRRYRLSDLPPDLTAGLTVAAIDMPQAMALGLIAGVPPIYGLYTAIVLGGIGALFTSSRYISIGLTNTQSLVLAAIVSRITHEPALYLQLAVGLALIKGLMQLALGAAGVGRLARYVSRSVMLGFRAGAGVLIVFGQLPALLGLPAEHRAPTLPAALGQLQWIAQELHSADLRAVGLGALSLAFVIAARRVSPFVPGPLLAVVSGALIVWMFGFTHGELAVVGTLPHGLPSPRLPALTIAQVEALLPGALALALLSMFETVAIAKGTVRRLHERIRPEQELFGQGLSHVIGSFLWCLPGSASFTRTELLSRSGAHTRFASLFCSLFTAALFLGLADQVAYIPYASLAGILIVVSAGMIDVPAALRLARTNRVDAAVCGVTFAAALLLPLIYAIYIGVFLNLALYLRQAGRLHLSELVPEGNAFVERPFERGAPTRELMLLQLEGELFFAVADELQERLAELVQSQAVVVIFRLKRVLWIDASVLFVLEHFAQAMQQSGGHVLLCGVRKELRAQLRDSGIDRVIGEENIIETRASVFASAQAALTRGEVLLAQAAAAREAQDPELAEREAH